MHHLLALASLPDVDQLLSNLKTKKMKKRIIMATSALAITAGSLFAYANTGETISAKAATEQCPPECCNGNSGECGPDQCSSGGDECCEK